MEGKHRVRVGQWMGQGPGEDLSHLPKPETVVPQLLDLLDRRPTPGRYRAADVAPSLTGVAS